MILLGWRPLLVLLLLVAIVALGRLFIPGTDQLLTGLRSGRAELQAWSAARPGLGELLFFSLYVICTALAIPGVMWLTILGGAVFGLIKATFLVALAAAAGATVAFLLFRSLLADWARAWVVRLRKSDLPPPNARAAALWLFAARLNLLIPFWIVTLAFACTRMRASQFWLITQIAILPGTLLYAAAGDRLASIESPSQLIDGSTVLIFAVLGLLPVLMQIISRRLKPQDEPRLAPESDLTAVDPRTSPVRLESPPTPHDRRE